MAADHAAEATLLPPIAKSPPPNIELVGIIVGSTMRIAIVRHSGETSYSHVTVGSLVDSWTVSAIGARSIALQSDQGTITIDLPVSKP